MAGDEFAFIDWIKSVAATSPDVLTGIGDDCAVVAFGRQKLLLKVDSLAEGVHFQRHDPSASYYLTPSQIGRKALARALSDIAAMGGKPRFALVAGALPRGLGLEFAKATMRGILDLAKAHDVALVGGETTVWKEAEAGVLLSITLIGDCAKPVLRSGARVGDSLWVSGALGGSGKGRHASFEPQLAQGQWLADFGASAMMDVSDGLASDLPHLLAASGVGATLELSNLPLHSDLGLKGRAGLLKAFGEGEDYVLLFALPSALDSALIESWPFGIAATRIGDCEAVHGLRPCIDGAPLAANEVVGLGWRYQLGG